VPDLKPDGSDAGLSPSSMGLQHKACASAASTSRCPAVGSSELKIRCRNRDLGGRLSTMNNNRMDEERQRFIVIFGKNAIDLEEKLNDERFVPPGYRVVQMAFNSAQGEFLTILENDWK
jgi:hypothetical protein